MQSENEAIGGVRVDPLIFANSVDCIQWTAVPHDCIPKAIKDPDCIAFMLSGEMAQIQGTETWWICAKTVDVLEGLKRKIIDDAERGIRAPDAA